MCAPHRLLCSLGATLLFLVPLVIACGSNGDDAASSTGPTGTSLSGTWTGRASGTETADFTFTLTQTSGSVTGTGAVSFPGDGSRFAFDATGAGTGSNVELTIQLRAPRQGPAITYSGKLDGSVTMRGNLNGGNIQHDGPFTSTPLTLNKQ